MAGLNPLTNLTRIDVVHLMVKRAGLSVVIIAIGIGTHKLANVLDSSGTIQAVAYQPAFGVNRDDRRGIGHKRDSRVIIDIHASGFGSVEIDDFHSCKSFRSGRLAPS